MYFSQKREGVILHDGNFDSTKRSLHPCLTLSGRLVFVSILTSEKKSATIWEKTGKKQKKNFITLFAQKTPERQTFDDTFSLKRNLRKSRKIN